MGFHFQFISMTISSTQKFIASKIRIHLQLTCLKNHSDQPDIQGHLLQNKGVADGHSPVQESLQILKCHREPDAIHE